MLRYIFQRRASVFDVAWITVLAITTHGQSWWCMLIIPLSAFSVIMERYADAG